MIDWPRQYADEPHEYFFRFGVSRDPEVILYSLVRKIEDDGDDGVDIPDIMMNHCRKDSGGHPDARPVWRRK